nr:MAG TPA: hypothetical protein [Caudoviricetes sp.]
MVGNAQKRGSPKKRSKRPVEGTKGLNCRHSTGQSYRKSPEFIGQVVLCLSSSSSTYFY